MLKKPDLKTRREERKNKNKQRKTNEKEKTTANKWFGQKKLNDKRKAFLTNDKEKYITFRTSLPFFR